MVTILVGPDKHKFLVHRQLLSTRSSHFRASLSPTSGFKEGQEGIITLEEDDPEAFKLIVHFFYTGQAVGLGYSSAGLFAELVSPSVVEQPVPNTVSAPPAKASCRHYEWDSHGRLDRCALQLSLTSIDWANIMPLVPSIYFNLPFREYSAEEIQLADYEFLAGRPYVGPEAVKKARADSKVATQERAHVLQSSFLKAAIMAKMFCWDVR